MARALRLNCLMHAFKGCKPGHQTLTSQPSGTGRGWLTAVSCYLTFHGWMVSNSVLAAASACPMSTRLTLFSNTEEKEGGGDDGQYPDGCLGYFKYGVDYPANGEH